MTKITIETSYNTITIAVPEDDLPFERFMEELVVPTLGCIYSHENVARWVQGEGGPSAFEATAAAMSGQEV